MKSLKLLIVITAFISSGLNAGQEEIIEAAKGTYEPFRVGVHANHIPASDIILNIDFFLRVIGSLKDNEKIRRDTALMHLCTVLGDFQRSRAEGNIMGWPYERLIVKAVTINAFIAARYFLNNWLREVPKPETIGPALKEALKLFLRPEQGTPDDLKRHIEQLDAAVRTYLDSLEANLQIVVQLEEEASQTFRQHPDLNKAPKDIVVRLRAILAQLEEINARTQKEKDDLDTRTARLRTQAMGMNQAIRTHNEVRSVLEALLTEYALPAFAILDIEYTELLIPDLILTTLARALPGPTLLQWVQLPITNIQTRPSVLTQVVRPRPTGIPTGRSPTRMMPSTGGAPGAVARFLGFGGK